MRFLLSLAIDDALLLSMLHVALLRTARRAQLMYSPRCSRSQRSCVVRELLGLVPHRPQCCRAESALMCCTPGRRSGNVPGSRCRVSDGSGRGELPAAD
eukprot:6204122-Alexandrium_andersonii.AAC.1